MSNKEKVIKHINIDGKNNDIIDTFEKYINSIGICGIFKQNLLQEFSKLRIKYKDEKINWTNNEQIKIKKLFNDVLFNENISEIKKTDLFVRIMNHKIINELNENKNIDSKTVKQSIDLIKKNILIINSGEITDEYLGISDYFIIIFPVIHRSLGQKNISSINKDIFLKLLVQNNNIVLIINELIKNNLATVYSFEGMGFEEISSNLPNNLSQEYIKLIQKYQELLKNIDGTNILELEKIQKKIIFKDLLFYIPEYLNKEKLLSFGIDNVINLQIILDTLSLISNLLNNPNIKRKELKNEIQKFLNKNRQNIISGDISDNYFLKLKKILFPDNFDKLLFEDYLLYLIKQNLIYTYKKRNEQVVENLEKLNDNTNQRGIILKFGADHFNEKIEYGIKEIDEELIPELKIKNIKQILKDKGISYIEISPINK